MAEPASQPAHAHPYAGVDLSGDYVDTLLAWRRQQIVKAGALVLGDRLATRPVSEHAGNTDALWMDQFGHPQRRTFATVRRFDQDRVAVVQSFCRRDRKSTRLNSSH